MIRLGFNYKIKEINKEEIKNLKFKNKKINIINTDFKFKRTFDKISNKSSKYIENSFKISLEILKKIINLWV